MQLDEDLNMCVWVTTRFLVLDIPFFLCACQCSVQISSTQNVLAITRKSLFRRQLYILCIFAEFIDGMSQFSVKGDKKSKLRCK